MGSVPQSVVAKAWLSACEKSLGRGKARLTMDEKQVAIQPLAAFLPTTLRLLVKLPDRVEDPAATALHARCKLLGFQLDFLGTDDLA